MNKFGIQVFIYQMGRVGSVAVRYAVESTPLKVEHRHYIFNRGQEKYGYSPEYLPVIRDESVKIISLTRDPIRRLLSSYFRPINYNEKKDWKTKDLLAEMLGTDSLFWTLHWFEQEFNPALKTDIYRQLPAPQGNHIMLRNRILVIQNENLNLDSTHELLGNFLGLNEPLVIPKKNRGIDRPNLRDLYLRFIVEVEFEKKFLETVYNSRYAKFFYSVEQRQYFIEYWSTLKRDKPEDWKDD